MQLLQSLCTRRRLIFLLSSLTFTALTLTNLFDMSLIHFHMNDWNEGRVQIVLSRSGCHRAKTTLQEITRPFSAFVFLACGRLFERIQLLNAALQRLKIQRFMPTNETQDWNISASDQLKLLAEWNESFFQELSNYSQVTTVILPWLRNPLQKDEQWSSLTDSSNLLIREYYESTATDPLCTWIETPGKAEFSFDFINNWTCNRNTTRGAIPRSISLLALNAKPPYKGYYFPSAFPDEFFTELPQILHSLYIIRSGIANGNGDVFIRNAKIVPYACFPDATLIPPQNIDKIPLYDEVFVIAQSYGNLMYHRLAEVTPRVAVFVEFLVRNPTIKILAPQNQGRMAELLMVLGITSDRVISGWCRAKIIYLPRVTTCCFPHFLETQLLSLHYRQYLKKNFPKVARNKVIFIRRTTYRVFKNQSAIERVVEMAAKEYNLSYEVFKDNPPPSLFDMMRMFNAAVMVVAPHGAGLANLVFSEPGTFVVEGVCNRPHTNLFFQRTAQVLGHRWHGIPSSGGCSFEPAPGVIGFVKIDPSIINNSIRSCLDLWEVTTLRNTSS